MVETHPARVEPHAALTVGWVDRDNFAVNLGPDMVAIHTHNTSSGLIILWVEVIEKVKC